jgi:hypothetical protein
MKHSQKILALSLVLVLVLAPLGCQDSDYTKAVKASDDIAAAVSAVRDIGERLYTDKHLIDKDEAAAIQVACIDTTKANGEFRVKLRALKTIGGDSKHQIGAWLGEVLTSLENLEAGGVFHVKNPDAQAQLAAGFQAARTAVAILQALAASNGIEITRPVPKVFVATLGIVPPAFSSSRPPVIADLPSLGFDDARCATSFVTESDIEFQRCPHRASLSESHFGGGA